MQTIKKLAYVIILLIVSSCALNKATKHLKKGETRQGNYKVTFPFEVKDG